MPARAIVSLVLIAIVAGGLTVLAAQVVGMPMGLAGLAAVGLGLAFRLWLMRR